MVSANTLPVDIGINLSLTVGLWQRVIPSDFPSNYFVLAVEIDNPKAGMGCCSPLSHKAKCEEDENELSCEVSRIAAATTSTKVKF